MKYRSDAKINTEKSFDLEIMDAPSKSVAQEENGIDKNAKVQTLQANGLGGKAGTGQYLQQLEDQRAMKVVMMILCLVSSPFDLFFVDEQANPKPGSFQAGFLNWFVLLTDIRSENNIWISDCRHCGILLCTFLTCL
jgi:hypothetical protein